MSCQSLRDAELQKTAGILAGCLMSLCHQQADAKVSLTDCIVLLKHSVHQLVAAQADAHSDFRAALVAKTLGFVYYCQWRAARKVRPRGGRPRLCNASLDTAECDERGALPRWARL